MSSWQIKKLGELLAIKHGRNQREVELKDGIYPILGTGGVIGHTNSFLYDKPSVLIGRKGTINKPRYMDTPFWTVDTLFYSEIKSENIAKYLYYVFNTIDWYRYNEASGVPSLSASTISTIKVAVPLKPEQERIVSVLEVWDEYLEKLDRKIALKEELKKGLMQQLLTGKKRFVEFNEEWVKSRIGKVTRFVNGYSFLSKTYIDNSTYKIITIANVQDGKMTLQRVNYIDTLPNNMTDEQILKAGDILVSMTGNVGRVCRVDIENCLLNQRVGKIIADTGVVNNDYIYYILLDRGFLHRMIQSAQGGAQDNLSSKDINKYAIAIPSLVEQSKIVNVIKMIDDELFALYTKSKNVRFQKKYLLKNLITGKIRTPENLTLKRSL